MPRNTQRFKAGVNAGRQATKARQISEISDQGVLKAARNVGTDAELIFREHAPVRSGRLARGIRATALGNQVVVTAVAVDPKTGFDYVAVTRFGHRKAVIVPVNRKGQARKSRTVRRVRGRFAKRAAGMLVFTSRGRLWRLGSVRGFKPRGDWVDKAWPEIKIVTDAEMEKIKQEIEVVWS